MDLDTFLECMQGEMGIRDLTCILVWELKRNLDSFMHNMQWKSPSWCINQCEFCSYVKSCIFGFQPNGYA